MKGLKILLIFSVMISLAVPGFCAEKADKIGYVDLSRLFDEYHVTKEYDKTLEQKHNEYEKESKEKIEKIRESQGKLALLKEDKKTEVEKEVETMKADLLEFDRLKKTDLTKERNEKIREILLEIEKIVSDFAEKNGYSVILNDRVLIYGAPGYDVTEEILKVLNAPVPAKAKN